jgi:hypothetical protein
MNESSEESTGRISIQLPDICQELSRRLTDRQRQYIVKLGHITGRKILPIDLGLYRELMKMQLIEDKGRRVALTKLGSEVFQQIL